MAQLESEPIKSSALSWTAFPNTHPIADGAPSPAPCEAPHSLSFQSTVTRDRTTMKVLVLESAWVGERNAVTSEC